MSQPLAPHQQTTPHEQWFQRAQFLRNTLQGLFTLDELEVIDAFIWIAGQPAILGEDGDFKRNSA